MSKATRMTKRVSKSQKHQRAEFWKRAKNVALHVQSRRENEFVEETLLPLPFRSRRNQRYDSYLFNVTHSSLLQKCPLGAGW